MNRYSCVALVALCFVVGLANLSANPATKTPETLLKIYPGKEVANDYLTLDYKVISERYARARKIADELAGKLAADKLTLGDAKQIAPLYLLTAKLKRDADYLALRGEASGHDLALRVSTYNRLIESVVAKILTLPGMSTKSPQAQLEKSHAAGLKQLPRIEALVNQQKFVQAEGELFEILDEMSSSAVWFPGADLHLMFKPFLRDFPQPRQQRRDQALADLQDIIDKAPKVADLKNELTQAATQIGATGQVSADGKMLSGPEFLAAWQLKWPKVQAGLQRAAMATWTSDFIRDSNPNQYQTLAAAQEQFAKSLPGLLAAIVSSDALRAAAPDASTLYPQYVAAAAGLCAIGSRQELDTAFTPALTALATKAGLDKEVAAYRTAMEPLLGWKRFLARSQAKALATKAEPVHDWLTKVAGPPANPQTILPERSKHISRAQLVNSVDQVLPAILPAGPAPTIVVTDIVPISPGNQRRVARYQQRVFALIGTAPDAALKSAGDQLEQQLLATPQQPPLSLDAATSLATARLGIFESAAGPVDQVTIEPFLTRFITLPDEGGALLPLGPLPTQGIDMTPPTQFLSLRCDIGQPQWLQHECFVLEK
ncbi:hypothetical protein [Anatilimnocola floriformis]|uniref:hypothetical protein n=1 Tax=Anatilimnocola floriformis TaxID=2948575 RepID=UPI0020C565D2|nr:hypothetical protein [Anatilimnocola floriformis]